MDKVILFLLYVFAFCAVFVNLSLLFTWPFMWMWNYSVVSALSVAQPITYWPAFCLMMFISLFCIGSRTSNSSS